MAYQQLLCLAIWSVDNSLLSGNDLWTPIKIAKALAGVHVVDGEAMLAGVHGAVCVNTLVDKHFTPNSSSWPN